VTVTVATSPQESTGFGPGIRDVTVIVTVFVRREHLGPLRTGLIETLSLQASGEAYWRRADALMLFSLDDGRNDYAVLRLALNGLAHRATSIGAAYREVREALDHGLMQIAVPTDGVDAGAAGSPETRSLGDLLLGCTVTYQVEVQGIAPLRRALRRVLPTVCPLHGLPPRSGPLAEWVLSEGTVWLVRVPLDASAFRIDPLREGTVYVAATRPRRADQLAATTTLDPQTSLPMIDEVAFGGYYAVREYLDEDKRDAYRKHTDAIGANIRAILTAQGRSGPIDQVERACDQHAKLTEHLARLDQLRIDMARHLINLRLIGDRLGGGEIVAYHAQQLETAERELLLLVEDGRDTADLCDVAVQAARARIDRQASERQEWFGTMLAVLGATLAIPELVDSALADECLTAIWRLLGRATPDAWGRVDTFAVQVVCIVLATPLVWLGMRLFWWVHRFGRGRRR